MNADQIEFQSRVSDYIKINPKALYVIRKKPEPAELSERNRARDEWFTYLHVNRHHATLKFWQFILQQNGSKHGLTVPCKTPEMFDMSYAAPAEIPDWGVYEPLPGEQRDISAVCAYTLESLRASVPRGKRPPQMKHEVVETPAEWLARNANPPPGSVPVLSDEALEKLGVRHDANR